MIRFLKLLCPFTWMTLPPHEVFGAAFAMWMPPMIGQPMLEMMGRARHGRLTQETFQQMPWLSQRDRQLMVMHSESMIRGFYSDSPMRMLDGPMPAFPPASYEPQRFYSFPTQPLPRLMRRSDELYVPEYPARLPSLPPPPPGLSSRQARHVAMGMAAAMTAARGAPIGRTPALVKIRRDFGTEAMEFAALFAGGRL